jgi:hypothetical protein
MAEIGNFKPEFFYSDASTKLSALKMPAKREFAIGQPGLVIVATNQPLRC